MSRIFLSIISVLIFLVACNDQDEVDLSGNSGNGGGGNQNGGGGGNNGWLIPVDEIFDGGPGKDGIPALENPEMITVSQASYLDDIDLVIGFKVGNDVRAYSHKVLDWHEIINDEIGTLKVAITYCPLTGTAIGWDRVINGTETTFGVSGLLYNSNLIPYDRATDSNWSQMLLQSVNGNLIETTIITHMVVETTWGNWKEMFPDTRVNSTNTGFNRNYFRFPYGDYRTNDNTLLFPFFPIDRRLGTKERVHGVIIDKIAKVYPISSFGDNVTIIEDSFQGRNLIVVGSKTRNFAVSFLDPGGIASQLQPVQDNGSIILRDGSGNEWNVFGEVVAGSQTGQKLLPTQSYIGYWFSWGAFYPGAEIYGQ